MHIKNPTRRESWAGWNVSATTVLGRGGWKEGP